MPIRLKDIAHDLGISMITVSKVLRNKPDVGQKTRERVLEKVKEVKYRPNMMARSLASGKSHAVGFIVPDLVHTFFAEVAKGMSGFLRRHAYELILASSEEDPILERDQIDNLLARGIDALLIASCQQDVRGFSRLVEGDIPYILIDRTIHGLDAHFVGMDDISIGYRATEHLILLGRRRIAHIGAESYSTAVNRLIGYKKALRKHGIPYCKDLIQVHPRLEYAGDQAGMSAMDVFLRRRKRPDAVFCFNDLTAVGAIQSIIEHGLRVPEDVAVIGCGNLRLSPYLNVPLSSVDQATSQLGERAAELALSLINGEGKRDPRKTLLEPHIIARKSTNGDGK